MLADTPLVHIGSCAGIWIQRLINGATSISRTARQASRCSRRWWRNEPSMQAV